MHAPKFHYRVFYARQQQQQQQQRGNRKTRVWKAYTKEKLSCQFPTSLVSSFRLSGSFERMLRQLVRDNGKWSISQTKSSNNNAGTAVATAHLWASLTISRQTSRLYGSTFCAWWYCVHKRWRHHHRHRRAHITYKIITKNDKTKNMLWVCERASACDLYEGTRGNRGSDSPTNSLAYLPKDYGFRWKNWKEKKTNKYFPQKRADFRKIKSIVFGVWPHGSSVCLVATCRSCRATCALFSDIWFSLPTL